MYINVFLTCKPNDLSISYPPSIKILDFRLEHEWGAISMIITTQKPIDEITSMLEPYNKIFIIGCGLCSTLAQTGGEKQVSEMVDKLKDKKTILGSIVIESPCDLRIDRKEIRKIKEKVENSDAILGMCCGAGVQTLVELTGKIIIPALNTCFLGEVERIGRFYERCRLCGDCILYETGGICPVARCAKGMMNGPCGGSVDGKCEVKEERISFDKEGNEIKEIIEKDCAWVLIYNRLKKLNRLDLFRKYRPPRDRSISAHQREVEFG